MNDQYKLDANQVLIDLTGKKQPKILVNFVARRLHQREMNDCIEHAQHPCGIGFYDEALKYLDIKFEVRGRENLPEDVSKFIFAGNHPLGGPEALILGSVFNQCFGESYRVPVNSLLCLFKPLAEFFIPVNPFGGRQSRQLGESLDKMFSSPYPVLVYPAGLCARKIKGKVTEMPWKKMFITQARKYQRDVVPMHMSGHNSRLFFFLTKVSMFFRLKFNLGMFLLVDELFKKQHQTFTITFGKPIPWQEFDSRKSDVEWAAWVREQVRGLQQGLGQENI